MTLKLSEVKFEDGEKTKFLSGRLKQLDWALLIFSSVGIFSGVMFVKLIYYFFTFICKCSATFPTQIMTTKYFMIQFIELNI
jgi:hypothetical protein